MGGGGSRLTTLLYSCDFFENRDYLREFEAKWENILGGLSGPQVELFIEKNRRRKSRDIVNLSNTLLKVVLKL